MRSRRRPPCSADTEESTIIAFWPPVRDQRDRLAVGGQAPGKQLPDQAGTATDLGPWSRLAEAASAGFAGFVASRWRVTSLFLFAISPAGISRTTSSGFPSRPVHRRRLADRALQPAPVEVGNIILAAVDDVAHAGNCAQSPRKSDHMATITATLTLHHILCIIAVSASAMMHRKIPGDLSNYMFAL